MRLNTCSHLLDVQRPSTQVMLVHSFYRLLHKLLILELHHTEQSGKQRHQMKIKLTLQTSKNGEKKLIGLRKHQFLPAALTREASQESK